MEHAEAMILGNKRVTVAEIAAKLGISIANSWCRLLVFQEYFCHTNSAQIDYN
jgi:hypothetical protein